jgi:hypothetical protein
MAQRRFPPPWSVEELDACFVVRDQSGQRLAYVYFENECRSGFRCSNTVDEMKNPGRIESAGAYKANSCNQTSVPTS